MRRRMVAGNPDWGDRWQGKDGGTVKGDLLGDGKRMFALRFDREN